MVEDDEVDGGGCSSSDNTAAPLTSMLRTSSTTRSSENLTPTAVVVKYDEDMVIEVEVVVVEKVLVGANEMEKIWNDLRCRVDVVWMLLVLTPALWESTKSAEKTEGKTGICRE